MYEEQSWRTRCMAKPKLRTYIKHKEQLDPEKYVTSHLSRKERSYLAQLRLGILPIKLETGRFENIKTEERLCELCDARVVEDEFLFKCTFNDSIRLNFLQKTQINGELNLSENVQSDIWKHMLKKHSRQCSKFIVKAYERRRAILYANILRCVNCKWNQILTLHKII